VLDTHISESPLTDSSSAILLHITIPSPSLAGDVRTKILRFFYAIMFFFRR
jgi:hypothetical protein